MSAYVDRGERESRTMDSMLEVVLNRPGSDGGSVPGLPGPGQRSQTHGTTFEVLSESRDRAIRIVRESKHPIAQVARDLGIHPETLRLWVHQDEADDGTRADRLTTAEREELSALRRENCYLRRSNETLKAASVFFAREPFADSNLWHAGVGGLDVSAARVSTRAVHL